MTYDQFLGALCLWREARGESLAAKTGIWNVILNRVKDSRWPNTVPGVILQRLQFSSFNSNDPNTVKFPKQSGGSDDWGAWLDCCAVVTAGIGGDNTGGANHYESLFHLIPETPAFQNAPDWVRNNQDKITARIGRVRFYRL